MVYSGGTSAIPCLGQGIARFGRLQADAAQLAAAIFGQQDHRRFFQIRLAAFAFKQTAAFFCDGFDHTRAIQPFLDKTVARGEQAGIACEQGGGEIFGDFLVYRGIAPDRVDRGELEAIFRSFDLRPQQAGRVGERHAVVDVVALLRLGDGGFVADIGDAAFEQCVHQRGFSDVGYAHDHQGRKAPDCIGLDGSQDSNRHYHIRLIGVAE